MAKRVDIFTACRARPFAVALLLYQFFFFNIVLPGHTRGAVTLDGRHVPPSSMPCCSACCPGGSTHDGAPGDAPSQHDRENCALCNFAARVTPPPVTSFTLRPLGLIEVLDPPAPIAAPSIRIALTLRDRAPPSMA